jgi:hypothetical protein
MVAICFGSFIIGYEMVAITMLEKEISNINGISGQKLQQVLTLVTAMMPLGAILGTAGNTQAVCWQERYRS